jgi:iron complex outermembrane recepter protein
VKALWPSLQSTLLASVALATAWQPARAQDASAAAPQNTQAAASSLSVEEVVVTAQRREQRLQDTPVAVSAYSTRSLAARGVTNISQLGQFTPSLVIQQANHGGGGGSTMAAYIRGVGTGDYNLPTDPAIGVYIDGVYLARSIGGLLSLPDVQQIEVLKGPQGTLWGRNSLGGAINIVTTQPSVSGPLQGTLEGRFGTYGRRDFSASINGPIVDDAIGGKFSISTLNSDGYGKSLATGIRLNDEDRFIVRGALRFKFANDLSLTLDADYTQQRQHPPVVSLGALLPPSSLVDLYNDLVAIPADASLGLPPGSTYGSKFLPASPYQNYVEGKLADNFRTGGLAATLVWNPSSALQVKSITAVRDLDALIDVDGDGEPYQVVAEQTHERDLQVSEELQVGGRVLDGRLTYLAGLYFFTETGHSRDDIQIFDGLYQATGNPALALNTDEFQRMKATSYAAFTQETYALLPNLRVTAGARVNYDQKDYDAFVNAPQLGTVAIPDQAKSPHWVSFTPKLGLDWNPTQQVLLYTSYAEGFKSGGISPPLVGLPLTSYSPETLRSYEVGAKTEWFDRRLTANFAAYYSIYHDIQLTTVITLPNGGVGRPVQNGGNADIYGFEGELVATPIERLTLNLSAAYTHDRFTYVTPAAAAGVGAYVGERLPDIPDYNFSVGAQYVFLTSLGDVTLRSDYSASGEAQLAVGDPGSDRDPYGLLNARIAFVPRSIPGLEVSVDGTNLTDRTYLTFSQNFAAASSRLQSPGAPRMVFGTIRYKF